MTAAVDVSELDKQNGVTLGRILGRGTVGHAEEGPDGKMHATVRIPEDDLIYEPRVLVMPHGSILELDGPGYYWYGSTTGNDEGRGLTGTIAVGGEVPPEAKLDRPPQPRP